MQEKYKIIENYKKKIETLKYHNHLYHNEDSPKISDSEFDSLKNELLELEKNYVFLKKLNLLSKIVGATPTNKFKKINHLRPMLSLSNGSC